MPKCLNAVMLFMTCNASSCCTCTAVIGFKAWIWAVIGSRVCGYNINCLGHLPIKSKLCNLSPTLASLAKLSGEQDVLTKKTAKTM